MPTNQLRVFLTAPDGSEIATGPDVVRIEVVAGMWIQVAFEMPDSTQLTVDLTLSGEAPRREGPGTTAGRFVIIPLDEFSLLVAVAEASDTPVYLTPLASTPVWTAPDAGPLPTREGTLAAETADGVGLILSFTPDAHEMDICSLIISSSPEDQAGNMRPALSILNVSQERLRIAATLRRAEENATQEL